MNLKAKRSFRCGTTNYRRGASVDVSDQVGTDLINRGIADLAPEAGPAPIRRKRATIKSPAKPGNQRRAKGSVTTGRAADRKED